MELDQVKRNMGKVVKHMPSGIDYVLTACILRQNEKRESFYQAELQAKRARSSLLICRLEDVEEL